MSSLDIAQRARSSSRATARRHLDVAALVPVLCPAALLAVVLAGIGRDILVPDTWVALVSGREIAEHGLPSAEHLTVLASGREWVDQQWLGQLALYALGQVGGVGLVVGCCLLCVVVAFGLAARAAQERGASPVAVLAFFITAFVAAPWGVQVRTQALALPLFSLVLWLVLRDPDARGRETLWVLPILCLWANIHGSVVLGAAIVAGYGAQVLVRRGWRARAALLVLLAPATVFASPYALQLPGYYRLMLFDPPFGHEIVEWQRTTPAARTAVFFALVVATVVLAVLRRSRLTLIDCLLLAVTLAAALSAIRLIPWFALTALAVVAPLATPRAAATSFRGKGATGFALAAAAVVLGAGGWAATRSYEAPSEARAVGVIREQARHEPVFADLDLADWLLWKIPQLRGKVAYDGRPELLRRREFRHIAAFERMEPGWEAAVRGYGVVVTSATIATRMAKTGRWRRVYGDEALTVVRATKRS